MNSLKYQLAAGLMLAGLAGGTAAAEQCTMPAQAQPGAGLSYAQEVRYRKNIDDLTPAELAAYKHAVKMMKVKSQENVFDRTGFLWQAWVHNCTAVDVLDGRYAKLSEADLKKVLSANTPDSCNIRNFLKVPGSAKMHVEYPGECEHQKDTFLQWHRAQLYFYEKALQNADPEGRYGPSTRNVSLPYWNFTQKPSGNRYPKVFEDPDSPLFDVTRNPGALPTSLPTASPYLLAYLIYYMDWDSFGGNQYGANGGGGLETKIHNRMHADYIGGNMGDNVTAGLDPVLYVFHNFLDYAFEKWLEEHGDESITGAGRSASMRGEQDSGLPKPIGYSEEPGEKKRSNSDNYVPDMGQAEMYFDTVKQGYGFRPHFGGEFIRKIDIEALIDQHRQAGFSFGDNEKSLFSTLLSYGDSGAAASPRQKLIGSYIIPAAPLAKTDKAILQFQRSGTAADYSFQADIYLYPQEVPENIADKRFRDRYLVTNTAHWAMTGHHAHGEIEVGENVSAIVNGLTVKKGGQVWNLTLAVSTSGRNADAFKEADFTLPSIVINPPKLRK